MSNFYDIVDQVFRDWNYSSPRILHSLIRALKYEVHVDCGTYRGLSACWTAQAMKENGAGRVHCIDNWSLTEHVERCGDPRTHAESNMVACGVRDWIEIHQGETSDPSMWPDKIDSCYVDAWHSYEAANTDFRNACQRGARLICLDDTENCVGPRMFVDELRDSYIADEFDILDLHSDNGMTIFLKKQPRRLITFSQELPLPHPGVDLRRLSLEQQKQHFDEVSAITKLDYSVIMNQTEYDMKL